MDLHVHMHVVHKKTARNSGKYRLLYTHVPIKSIPDSLCWKQDWDEVLHAADTHHSVRSTCVSLFIPFHHYFSQLSARKVVSNSFD